MLYTNTAATNGPRGRIVCHYGTVERISWAVFYSFKCTAICCGAVVWVCLHLRTSSRLVAPFQREMREGKWRLRAWREIKYLVECYRCPGLEAASMDSLFDFLAQIPVPLSSNLSHLMKYNALATAGGHVDSTHFECTAVSSRS